MITLRCTQRLLKHLGPPQTNITPYGRLGDWYANPIRSGRRRVVLCTNANTLLSVVIPLFPIKSFVDRFRHNAQFRINQIDAPPEERLKEISALSTIQIGKTQSRSVLASMNQLGMSAEFWLIDTPNGDLEVLGQWLCDTPCSALRTHWPWYDAELLLTGKVSSPNVKIRPPRVVL